HGHTLAELGRAIAFANVDLTVFLGELVDHRLGIFDDVAVATLGRGSAAVAGERFGAGIKHDLAGHRGADDRADDRRGAILQRAEAAANNVHVIVDIGAGTNLGEVGHQVRLERGGGRTAGN